jgi:hypothetical protein
MVAPARAGGPYRPGPVDATMVANANAETTLLRRTPAVDEYPDPYGAPMPPAPAPRQEYPGQGGYGQGYPASPYQEPTTPYQAPVSGGGYGSGYPASGPASGGYGGGYSDPTQPVPGSSYRPPTPRPPAPGMPGSPAAPGSPGALADPYGAPPQGGEYENRGGYGGGAQYGAKQPRPEDATGRFTNYDQVYDQPRGDQSRGAEGGYGGGYPPAEKPYGSSPKYGAATEYGGGATTEYGGGATNDHGAATEYGGSRGGYGTGQEYQPPAPRGGYESQPGGYEPSPGGYGAAPRSGYDSPDEYPPTTTYDPRAGYDGEYGQGRSRHSAPQQPPNYSAPGQDQRPDQRRSLDWLDD